MGEKLQEKVEALQDKLNQQKKEAKVFESVHFELDFLTKAKQKETLFTKNLIDLNDLLSTSTQETSVLSHRELKLSAQQTTSIESIYKLNPLQECKNGKMKISDLIKNGKIVTLDQAFGIDLDRIANERLR